VTLLLTLGRRKPADADVHDLSIVVEGLTLLLRRVLPDSVEVLMSTGDENTPAVHADHAQLEQVILNLVVNARDAMPMGGTLAIRTEVVAVDDQFAAVNGGAGAWGDEGGPGSPVQGSTA
jgi:two-component system cell cycle sensor histidine kinase/response regulator CckA